MGLQHHSFPYSFKIVLQLTEEADLGDSEGYACACVRVSVTYFRETDNEPRAKRSGTKLSCAQTLRATKT